METVVLVIFLGITYLFGLWDIFKEMQQDGPEAYTQVVFSSCIVCMLLFQAYICAF